jgi:hypothetical protein
MTLGQINGSVRKDVARSTNFELQFHPLPESDFIAYVPGAAIFMDITLSPVCPGNPLFGPQPSLPMMAPGGTIQRPLNEYADPVTDIVDIGEVGLSLEALGDQERRVHRGETVIFKEKLLNSGNATGVEIDIVGAARDWARMLSPVALRAVAEQDILVAVSAPADAVDRETADLIIEVTNLNDIEDRSLIRFVAVVDST